LALLSFEERIFPALWEITVQISFTNGNVFSFHFYSLQTSKFQFPSIKRLTNWQLQANVVTWLYNHPLFPIKLIHFKAVWLACRRVFGRKLLHSTRTDLSAHGHNYVHVVRDMRVSFFRGRSTSAASARFHPVAVLCWCARWQLHCRRSTRRLNWSIYSY
jgi:hypothetical protein